MTKCEVNVRNGVFDFCDIHVEARTVAIPGLEIPHTNKVLRGGVVVDDFNLAAIGDTTVCVRFMRTRSIVDTCVDAKLLGLDMATVSIYHHLTEEDLPNRNIPILSSRRSRGTG